ncbi:hypothetical protein SAMN05216337_10404 [Bradyrhizobium brasilense]|uniref:Uncharacterized protein n=1 Tax=Bradyrhizobium brasilense TaxID=1419277 RepID=A0A1G7H1P4_9BRAD|nr:hypothetical protein SAMN05216337_10404 [Bradyrhizobium brasilense]
MEHKRFHKKSDDRKSCFGGSESTISLSQCYTAQLSNTAKPRATAIGLADVAREGRNFQSKNTSNVERKMNTSSIAR